MQTSIPTNYDPEIPVNLREEDCLEFAGTRGGVLKFHKNTGYFYCWEVGAQGEVRLRCACKQFMVKHHTSKCIYNETELEMTETCWLSGWFPLGSGDRWHNHPPPSRASVELHLFKWQVNLSVVKSRNGKLINHAVDEMYSSWPFILTLSNSQLKKLIYTAGDCKILGQDGVDSMMAILMTPQEYLGPPVESNIDKQACKESQQCCGEVGALLAKRKLICANSKVRKKIKQPLNNESDYDTEPLPEKSTKANNINEPIASGSCDYTPQAEKFIRCMPMPSQSESRIQNAPVEPTTCMPKDPFSQRRTHEDIKVEPREIDDSIRIIRFAESLVKQSQKIDNQLGVNLYTIPLHKMEISRSGVGHVVFGKPDRLKEHRTVLFLGTVGASQAKFINSIINYVFHVRNQDDFRFHVAEEKQAGNLNGITVYDIHHSCGFRIPYSLTIIHSPGYSDVTDGKLFRHRELTKLFREFFCEEHGIEKLDMVCNLQLKDETNNSFLSIFGYDVEENVHCFLPKDNSFPTVEFIQRFFSVLESMKPKSLKLTKEVMDVMKRLEKTMDAFFPLVKSVSVKLDELKNARQVVSICQSQIGINKQMENKFNLDTAAEKYNVEVLWKTVQSGGHELHSLLKTEFNTIVKTVLEHFETASASIQQLKRISRGNPFLTQELYDLLFEVKQKLKHFGHGEKIETSKTVG